MAPQVFGDEWWSFCFPVFSSFGDGLTFPQVCENSGDVHILADLSPLKNLQRLSDDAELGLSTTTTHLRQGELATIT